jgi:uncharacterized protein
MSDQNMKRRNFALIAGILAIGMVAATIVGGQMMTTAAAQEQPTKTTDGDKPTVSTSGSATVKVDPDRVTVTIGVETKGETAAKAVADNSEIMKRVLDALKGLGITANQTATSNYSVFPIYESISPPCIMIYPQPPECAPKSEVTGYRAVNSVSVTLEATADVGKVIDAAVNAGANNVSGAYFFVSEAKQQEIRDSLIELAIDNARSRADKAAAAVDMTVVSVQSINLNDFSFPVYYKNFDAAQGENGGTDILPGQQEVAMSVQVTFVMG